MLTEVIPFKLTRDARFAQWLPGIALGLRRALDDLLMKTGALPLVKDGRREMNGPSFLLMSLLVSSLDVDHRASMLTKHPNCALNRTPISLLLRYMRCRRLSFKIIKLTFPNRSLRRWYGNKIQALCSTRPVQVHDDPAAGENQVWLPLQSFTCGYKTK